ncbi:histidine phosphatase family protein [Heyndrickxia vini]|uniref:Histidine phosphatase family protein n=1 Tax=Heyndrickxia vini TaxID=1476025 RepID=A0ABX7DWF5_9BACI|nr:histidine phosphatase family protein [Heyndrickxia vini]QQZ07656.1 histidine phosphatase family protein [Heyndrickxia vini]
MVTNLYFVRHAHSVFTLDELGRPLSERGFCDASHVTQLLKTADIHHVISSPYKRAIQTVEGIANCIDNEIEIVDAFKERFLSEKPVNDFDDAIQKVWKDIDFHWEGGESNRIAQNRGVKATLNVLEKYKGKNIVIGTHGNLMVLILNYFDSSYGFNFWKELSMPDIYRLSFFGKELKGIKQIWK